MNRPADRGPASWLPVLLALGAGLAAVFVAGCASPGPPRAPSLHLPEPVNDLTARRSGNTVELRFTVPRLSTDKQPLYDVKHHRDTLHGVLCRELDRRECVALAGISPALTAADHTLFTWQDTLPPALTSGAPRLLGYRVEFFNAEGRSAGKSDAAYTATGPAPPPVTALHAEGTRDGVVLRWAPAPAHSGEVLLQRVDLAPRPPAEKPPVPAPKPSAQPTRTAGTLKASAPKATPANELWLMTNATDDRTLDAEVIAGDPYRYTAVRRILVALGARNVELRSEPSAAVDFTLRDDFPPATPTGLTAAGFQPPPGANAANPSDAHYAIDLIWQPVDDTGGGPHAASPLAGYNIYRETLSASGQITAARTRLNAVPAPLPAYHDATAAPAEHYRYSVTAVDGKGNESAPATVTLEPNANP